MYSWILTALIWAFSFWMVADAVRRRLSFLWVVVILLVQPYGGLAYLLYLKLATSPRLSRMFGNVQLSKPPSPVTEPGDPALVRADQLEDQRRFGEAAALYERALESQANDPRALHGLARCLMEGGQDREGLEKYEALMAVDPRFRNYSARSNTPKPCSAAVAATTPSVCWRAWCARPAGSITGWLWRTIAKSRARSRAHRTCSARRSSPTSARPLPSAKPTGVGNGASRTSSTNWPRAELSALWGRLPQPGSRPRPPTRDWPMTCSGVRAESQTCAGGAGTQRR